MCQKLPVNGFKWVNNEINEEFIKHYDENSDKGYIFEVDVKYPRKLHDLHSDLPFLSKRMKINKCKKLICNLLNQKKIRCAYKIIKTRVKSWIKIKKIHRVIEFKPYTNMNTELRKVAKNDFKKNFFTLMNNSVFGKTMENIRKHRDINPNSTNVYKSSMSIKHQILTIL